MSRLIIYFYCALLLLVGGHASDTESEENTLEDEPVDERDKLIDSITDDYLEIINYEMNQCRELFEKVLEDRKLKSTRSEILQGKKTILQDFIIYVTERQKRPMPPQSHRPARFFHVFGKALLYKDFLGIVARLEPKTSRYDDWIQVALFDNGFADFLGTLREKRTSLINKAIRKIERYVKGLTAAERRKAAGQKMVDWSVKMKDAPNLEQKMDVFKEFLRYEYLEFKIADIVY